MLRALGDGFARWEGAQRGLGDILRGCVVHCLRKVHFKDVFFSMFVTDFTKLM